ncbi:hypothetical protein HanRHA438_Chr15g0720181 [Helianthus annuus]|nr:hypothetical protein HanRHA438_Chr15g0720181 [Helianthus annuus]
MSTYTILIINTCDDYYTTSSSSSSHVEKEVSREFWMATWRVSKRKSNHSSLL